MRYQAVLFDLLTALLDSWTLWDAVAGGLDAGRRWRMRYLALTYGCGEYVDYEELVRRSALETGLGEGAASELTRRWVELAPWPEVPEVLQALSLRLPLGVVTNCSERLGAQAASRLGVPVHLVTAERAGAYKPDVRPYQLALRDLEIAPESVLFVAGSPSDIGGASRAGMPVYWHNRIGLALPPGSSRPVVETNTLSHLPAFLNQS